MIELSREQIAEFWHRSYTSVDGLWFMKVEEKYGFDVALDIDDEVWKVLPKLQARMIKSMGGLGEGIDGLFEGLTTKLSLEGFAFETERDADGTGFTITLGTCPWHDLMVKSGREALSERVGTLICNTENTVWASEFGEGIRFELGDQICARASSCRLWFSAP
jgi:hypothetical protein